MEKDKVFILQMIIIAVLVKDIISLGVGHDNETECNLTVIAAWPPIWKTTYTYRILGYDNAYVSNPDQYWFTTSPEFVLNATLTTSPWNYINQDTSFLDLICHEYNNSMLGKDINDGQLTNYSLLLSFLFTNCRVDHLSDNAFRGLKRLRGIYIHNNGLHSISLRAFEDCSDLLWLNIEKNYIMYISAQHFCNNPKLEFVQMKKTLINDIQPSRNSKCVNLSVNSLVFDNCKLIKIKPYTFKPFAVAGVLSITNASITSVTKTSFEGLERALDLDLEKNEISCLEENTFDSMKINLQKISLSRNRLTNITIPNVFDTLNISHLILDNNLIESVHGTFSKIHKLQHLDISCNKIESIKNLFKNTLNLKYLSVRSNLVTEIRQDDLLNMGKIETFDISDNRITELPDKVFSGFISIKEIRLRNNNLSAIPEEFCVKCKCLSVLDVSQNRLKFKSLKIDSNSLKFFDFSNNEFENIPKLFDSNGTYICSGLVTLNASRNSIEHVSINCLLSLVTFEINDNKIKFLPQFEKMPKLKTVQMRRNQLQSIQKKALCGEESHLTYVDLGENIINTIDTGAFENCIKLETLLLDHNRLKTLNNYPTTLKMLALSKNPFTCVCELKHFVDTITLNKALHTDNITCLLNGQYIDIKKANIQECVMDHTKQLIIDIVVPAGSVVLVGIILASIIFKYRYEIEVVAFYKWNIRLRCCFGKKRQMTSFRYDAFICFAEEDLDFVKNRLIDLLEPRFRLCVYYRDFPVGTDIAEAILDVIDDSSVIIVLLSEAFLQSRWGNFEFRHAHHNSMHNEDQKLLVIVLEESVLDMKLDLTLKSILFSKAYLKKNDTLFDQKLFYAMPAKTVMDDDSNVRNFATENNHVNVQEHLIN